MVLSQRGSSEDGSRGRRGCDVDIPWRWGRGDARLRRGYSVETGRGDAAAATWTFRGGRVAATPRLRRGHSVGDGSRLRRGCSVVTGRGDACDVDIPWRQIAATPRPRRGHSVETSRGGAAAATWKFGLDRRTPRYALEKASWLALATNRTLILPPVLDHAGPRSWGRYPPCEHGGAQEAGDVIEKYARRRRILRKITRRKENLS